ncbi:MAG: hypothetical protein AAFY21_06505 [Cyanobacteria bacterium J06641_2]
MDYVSADFLGAVSAYSPVLILINSLVTFAYTICTFLAQKQMLPPFLANGFRLFSVIVSSLLLTLLFAKHGIDALNQQDSLLIILGALGIIHWFYLWLKDFDIRYVLSTQVITTIFFLVVWACQLNVIIKGGAALLWLLSIYSLALALTHVFSFSNFSVFQLFSKELEHYEWYKHFMQHARVDRAMVLYVPCGLTINTVNLIYIIQVGDGWLVYLLIGICLLSIGYQTLLAIGLCALCETHPVKYRWNFVIQSYLNLWVTFKTVWQQTCTGNLPSGKEIPLVNLGMAFLLAALQSPIVGYCAGPEATSAGASSELTSDEGSRGLFGNKNKPTSSNKAVGEGAAASKAAKMAKPAVDYAAKEAKDITGRYYDKGKDTAAGAAVAATVAGGAYSLAELAKLAGFELPTLPGTSASPSTQEQVFLQKKLNDLKREGIALTKAQLELEKKLTEEIRNKKSTE